MPVYEYSCGTCGEHFEQYRKVTARSAARCPDCGGRGRKVFRPVGIIFKGSGFHCTDYRPSGDKQASDTSTSESKPAATATETSGKSD
jgi:putative FmdB family regulatory protein